MTDNVIISTIIRHNMEWNSDSDFCVACGRYTIYTIDGVDYYCLVGCKPTDTPLDGVAS